MLQYALIADDLTGALDAGAGFARAGLRATLPFSGRAADAPDADVVLINTDTRERTAQQAAQAARVAAEQVKAAGVERVYKKIDSVLRGHPGPELSTILDVFGGRAIVAPAFPAQARVTAGGVQFVQGRPAVAYGGQIHEALGTAASRSVICDAASEADLAAIARKAAADPACRVWCGSAGLAAAAPAALGLARTATGRGPSLSPATYVLAIVGTPHPTTATQLQILLHSGWHHVPFDTSQAEDPAAIHDFRDRLRTCLTAVERAAPERAPGTSGPERMGIVVSLQGPYHPTDRSSRPADPSGEDPPPSPEKLLHPLAEAMCMIPLPPGLAFIMTGGQTALEVCLALGAVAIHLVGEALPGIPLGLLELPQGRHPIATKSGGFGDPDALFNTAVALLHGVIRR